MSTPLNTKTAPLAPAMAAVEDLADRAAARTDSAIQGTRQMTNDALDALQSGVDSLRTTGPGALSRAAAQVDDLTRRGIERARETGATVKDKVSTAGDRSVAYIRDEPVKSILIAAATGAAVAALVGWLSRSRAPRA